MKAVFIINPEAGKGKGEKAAEELIEASGVRSGGETEFYVTKAVGDAERFTREYCRENPGEELRLIACGGDGTLNEVINGAAGFDNALVGVMPTGTGNDFCRNFPDAGDFMNAKAQLEGTAVECDAIRYTAFNGAEEMTRYCANMFNIGFDCNVVDKTNEMKKLPFISGSLAYLLSVFIILIKKKGADLDIELDGERVHSGRLLLTSLANGCFCGGGVKSNPGSSVHDGMIDVNIVQNTTRLNFIHLFPYYKKGTHMEQPDIGRTMTEHKCRRAVIKARNGAMRLCIDGEITDAEKAEFEAVHDAFRFIIPAKG
ncbi:MAG: YegS/Rv2252/BmrU family lipid kinase [Oscillospiraceae bacterium]|nr:YegS/Rv2252/BmrU family lipid kinase [Oscillospiraceae bacterium]